MSCGMWLLLLNLIKVSIYGICFENLCVIVNCVNVLALPWDGLIHEGVRLWGRRAESLSLIRIHIIIFRTLIFMDCVMGIIQNQRNCLVINKTTTIRAIIYNRISHQPPPSTPFLPIQPSIPLNHIPDHPPLSNSIRSISIIEASNYIWMHSFIYFAIFYSHLICNFI